MHHSVSELSWLQLVTSGSYGLSVLGVGDRAVVFWKENQGNFQTEDFCLVCFILSSNYGNCLFSWDQFMFCQCCKELPVEPWINWKHVGSQYRWCSLALRRKLRRQLHCWPDLPQGLLKSRGNWSSFPQFSRERMSRIEFLQASRFLWGVSVEQNKRGSYTGSPLGSNIRKACTQIISNNNAMDAESILSARVTVLTDITFGPSLW